MREKAQTVAPGVAVATVIAITAQFMMEHYGAPAMLMALLLGIAFHFLAEEGKCVPGIEFSAKRILRIGVALLGARVSVELLVGLGPQLLILVLAGVVATILFGVLLGRFLDQDRHFALLTGGSVAICGASAAMAISAVLPKNEQSERNLIFTVLAVTVMSTVAMIAYPILAAVLDLDFRESGVFLGGTIHDVAQVVGAGFSVSEETGEAATLVKLMRVTMLAPVVLVIALLVRKSAMEAEDGAKRPPLIPLFVLVFLFFAALNSFHLMPQVVVDTMNSVSRWALLISIAAVGMKTSIRRMLDVGGPAILLITAETAFIAVFVLAGVLLL
ncbi:MAG: YeiH family protein [Pseudomonadota bacterium]